LLHPDPTSTDERANSASTQETTFMNSPLAFIEPTDRGLADQVFTRTVKDGEERLMLAVLQSAVEDFQKYVLAQDKRGKELFQQAEDWILESDSASFFSFENVCAHLQLAPDYVRRGFMRWKAAKCDGELKRPSASSGNRHVA
jgi:hypothetical protein